MAIKLKAGQINLEQRALSGGEDLFGQGALDAPLVRHRLTRIFAALSPMRCCSAGANLS